MISKRKTIFRIISKVRCFAPLRYSDIRIKFISSIEFPAILLLYGTLNVPFPFTLYKPLNDNIT